MGNTKTTSGTEQPKGTENNNNINPQFTFEDFKNDAEQNSCGPEPIHHNEILSRLLEQITPVNFRDAAGLADEKDSLKPEHYFVICIQEMMKVAHVNNWGMCRNHDFIYVYNGAFWKQIDDDVLHYFLGRVAEKMGVDKFKARYNMWCSQLYKQFIHAAHLPKPEPTDDVVLINFKNGTFEISPHIQQLREFRREDFITYQLPFEYDPCATAPIFKRYLEQVQPDETTRYVLGEYIGYVFIPTSYLKLEKVLLLYGAGANGKSVFFEVVNALLGKENNVSNYSLQSLTNDNGYFRAMLGNKLLNYASEINGKIEHSHFKLLASGEPIEARLPYGRPMIITNYAKLLFNCNELPMDVEQTHSYYRRLIIAPFNVTIPEQLQDKELARKIIKNELSGVFNWALAGLQRLLVQKRFTYSETVERETDDYKQASDSVRLFIGEEGYMSDTVKSITLHELYVEYKDYCRTYNYHCCTKRKLAERLRNIGIIIERKNSGNVVFLRKQ